MAIFNLGVKFNNYYYNSDLDRVFSTKSKTYRPLVWCKNNVNSAEYVNVVDCDGNKTRLYKFTIKQIVESGISACIMKIGDYISSKTLRQLTEKQYDDFRTYLRQCGYHINYHCGNYQYPAGRNEFVKLDQDGDLSWGMKGSGKEIMTNKILNAIQSMKSSTTSKYFVMRIHDGIPIVNCDAQIHATEELARAAAEKLAKENPTQKFYVLKHCGEVQACGIEWK